jgi:ABC-type phosphate transport system permease subunit
MEIVSELETWIQVILALGALGVIIALGAIVLAFASRSFPPVDSDHEGYGAILESRSWKDVDEEDRYDGPVLPTGVVAAAVASRWRDLRTGEGNLGRMTDFSLASAGDFHSRH